MSDFDQLKELMRTERAVPGRVVAILGGVVRVATPSGVLEVAGDGDLQVGDAVTVQNGRAVKKRLEGEAPVFFV